MQEGEKLMVDLEDSKKEDEEEMTEESEEELKGKTWEEKLAILEKSDESDLEIIRKTRASDGVFSDASWKLGVGLFGSGLAIILVIITLRMVEALLSGSF